MMEELEYLVALQAIDVDLARLREAAAAVPRELAALEAELAAARSRFAAVQQTAEETMKTRRSKEGELKTVIANRDGRMQKLAAIKTNQEYTAAMHELEAMKTQIGELEDTILELMEKEKEADREVAAARKALAAEEERIRGGQETQKRELARIEAECAVREEERGAAAGRVPAQALSRYERIRGGKAGLAVVPIENGVCGGCFRRLPPQLMLEVKIGPDIVYCQFCGRMLHPGAGEASESSGQESFQ